MYNRYRGNSSRRPYIRSRFGRQNNRFSTKNRDKVAQSIRAHISKTNIPHYEKREELIQTKSFHELGFDERIMKNIQRKGYATLTPIQEKGIPAVREGKDVIGIANTGTGKTASFLLPLIENILKNPYYKALIITPTRELALQIQDELRAMSDGMRVYSAFCIGKSSIYNQISQLRRNPNVVIGTPGRLKDLIERRILQLKTFNMIVLDEVDQMLDMGFIQDVRHIISFLPEKRQSLFYSATVSPQIDVLIKSFVRNPITISVKRQETTHHIKQDVIHIREGEHKMEVLQQLLTQGPFKKVLVFGRTKRGVEKISQELFRRGHKVTSIHGDKPQFQRIQAIRMFKEDVVKILVATDVAARGLDINDVSHVVNYDVPETFEDYIHRIGRTGRAGKDGTAVTFI